MPVKMRGPLRVPPKKDRVGFSGEFWVPERVYCFVGPSCEDVWWSWQRLFMGRLQLVPYKTARHPRRPVALAVFRFDGAQLIRHSEAGLICG